MWHEDWEDINNWNCGHQWPWPACSRYTIYDHCSLFACCQTVTMRTIIKILKHNLLLLACLQFFPSLIVCGSDCKGDRKTTCSWSWGNTGHVDVTEGHCQVALQSEKHCLLHPPFSNGSPHSPPQSSLKAFIAITKPLRPLVKSLTLQLPWHLQPSYHDWTWCYFHLPV